MAYRERFREIRFHYEGSLIQVARLPGWEPCQRANQKKRGLIGGSSIRAGGRLMNIWAQIRRNAMALFVTLTYPQFGGGRSAGPEARPGRLREMAAGVPWLLIHLESLNLSREERRAVTFSCGASLSSITSCSPGVGSSSSAARIQRTSQRAPGLKRFARVVE
jgi:hypothetical protein